MHLEYTGVLMRCQMECFAALPHSHRPGCPQGASLHLGMPLLPPHDCATGWLGWAHMVCRDAPCGHPGWLCNDIIGHDCALPGYHLPICKSIITNNICNFYTHCPR